MFLVKLYSIKLFIKKINKKVILEIFKYFLQYNCRLLQNHEKQSWCQSLSGLKKVWNVVTGVWNRIKKCYIKYIHFFSYNNCLVTFLVSVMAEKCFSNLINFFWNLMWFNGSQREQRYDSHRVADYLKLLNCQESTFTITYIHFC